MIKSQKPQEMEAEYRRRIHQLDLAIAKLRAAIRELRREVVETDPKAS